MIIAELVVVTTAMTEIVNVVTEIAILMTEVVIVVTEIVIVVTVIVTGIANVIGAAHPILQELQKSSMSSFKRKTTFLSPWGSFFAVRAS